jgi:formiminotetrahydrofolate cyclodeaminase
MIDADTTAFNDFMEALRMPRSTDAERRNGPMHAGRAQEAIEFP